jgi:hypothetical protein
VHIPHRISYHQQHQYGTNVEQWHKSNTTIIEHHVLKFNFASLILFKNNDTFVRTGEEDRMLNIMGVPDINLPFDGDTC